MAARSASRYGFFITGRARNRGSTQLMAQRWAAANGNAELQLVPESPHAFVLFGTAIARKVTAYVDWWLLEQIAVATTDVARPDRCEEAA